MTVAVEVLAHGGVALHDLVPLVVVGTGALVVLAGYVRGGRRQHEQPVDATEDQDAKPG